MYRMSVVSALVLWITFATVAAGDDSRGAVPAVSVEEVSLVTQSQPKTYVGTVEGAETVDIVARVSGTLMKAHFREGGMVKAGDVLYEIEDTVYAARVKIAEALIRQCETDYELAVKEHVRSAGLLKSSAIPEQTFDATLAAENLTRAKLEEARANLVLARHDLEHCRIVSPIAGRIGEKRYSEGNYITPALGVLATVVQYQPVKVTFSMSESEFFRSFNSHDEQKNMDLAILRANGSPYRGEAAVDFVDNRVDSRTTPSPSISAAGTRGISFCPAASSRSGWRRNTTRPGRRSSPPP